MRTLRQIIRGWIRKDRRPKTFCHVKFAVDRDGDLFIIECPKCHSQVYLDKEGEWGTFRCNYHGCRTLFQIYTEDGIRIIKDFRDGDLEKGAVLVYDNKELCAGIDADAPWWWPRRYLSGRDLRPNGKDAHGHKAYQILPDPCPTDLGGTCCPPPR